MRAFQAFSMPGYLLDPAGIGKGDALMCDVQKSDFLVSKSRKERGYG